MKPHIMKILALILNIALFLFTLFVIVTDGFATQAAYIVLTLWVLLTLLFNPVALFRGGSAVKIPAVICNIIFIGFVIWALVDQYPHPRESGYIPFVILMFLTPIVTVVALLINLFKQKQALA